MRYANDEMYLLDNAALGIFYYMDCLEAIIYLLAASLISFLCVMKSNFV